MPLTKIKKVVATVKEQDVDPEYTAQWNCPYCGAMDYEDVYEGNCTDNKTCYKCEKKYKVKIPKESQWK